MRIAHVFFVLNLSLCASFAARAGAATLDVNTILGPDHPYRGETITVIDGLDPPTIVTVLEGAQIGNFGVPARVTIGFDIYGTSVVDMLGGVVEVEEYPVLVHDNGTFRMREGHLRFGDVEARDHGTVIVDGGEANSIRGIDSSTIRINGGQLGDLVTLGYRPNSSVKVRLVVGAGLLGFHGEVAFRGFPFFAEFHQHAGDQS